MTVLRDHTESCIQLKHLGLYMGLLSSNHCNALDLVLDRQYNSLEGSHGIMSSKVGVVQEITIFIASFCQMP